MKNLLINADDFGASPSINKAVAELFNANVINSATLMANMPAFDDAIQLAFKNNFSDKLGAHLVLTEGIPLTEEIRTIRFFFNGRKSHKKFWPLIYLQSRRYQSLIYKELAAQIEKIKANNIKITHLDTHHHVHEIYIITKIMLRLSKEYQIPSIRILNNLQKSSKPHKKIYRRILNYYIKKNRANFSDFFGDRNDFLLRFTDDPSVIDKYTIEIMVHPDYNATGKLIDREGIHEYDFQFLLSFKQIFA